MTIKITASGMKEIPFESFTFSGGEEQIKISSRVTHRIQDFTIYATLTSSAEILKLIMVTDALRRATTNAKINLNMPYIPYARQDRVCNPGEALGIRVFCDLINSLKFNSVRVLMPHSDVALALLDNVNETVHQYAWDCFVADSILSADHNNLVIVSPDAGAVKRTLKFAQWYNKRVHGFGRQPLTIPVVMADKVRDVTNGNITHTTVHESPTGNDVEGKACLIYDDICDGGMTFIKLAEELRFHGAARVILAAPHGIFSKGVSALVPHIDHIITTNVFKDNLATYAAVDIDILEVV